MVQRKTNIKIHVIGKLLNEIGGRKTDFLDKWKLHTNLLQFA